MKIEVEKILVVYPDKGCRKAWRLNVYRKQFIFIYGKLLIGIIPKMYASTFNAVMTPELKLFDEFLWNTEEDLQQFKRKE